MTIQFRCSHRDYTPTPEDVERIPLEHVPEDQRGSGPRKPLAALRRELFDVPSNTKWSPVVDVRPGADGPEIYEVGTHLARVTCPLCGDEVKIVTDQDVHGS